MLRMKYSGLRLMSCWCDFALLNLQPASVTRDRWSRGQHSAALIKKIN